MFYFKEIIYRILFTIQAFCLTFLAAYFYNAEIYYYIFNGIIVHTLIIKNLIISNPNELITSALSFSYLTAFIAGFIIFLFQLKWFFYPSLDSIERTKVNKILWINIIIYFVILYFILFNCVPFIILLFLKLNLNFLSIQLPLSYVFSIANLIANIKIIILIYTIIFIFMSYLFMTIKNTNNYIKKQKIYLFYNIIYQ